MLLAAEDHVVHVAMTDVVFLLHCTIPFNFSLTRLLYARANEKLYEKGQPRIKKRHRLFIRKEYTASAKSKSVADFYPQGVCGIRKAAKLLTAAQAPAHGAKKFQSFFLTTCASEKTPLSPQTCAPSARALPRAASPSKKRQSRFFEVSIACRGSPPHPPARRPCSGRRCARPTP